MKIIKLSALAVVSIIATAFFLGNTTEKTSGEFEHGTTQMGLESLKRFLSPNGEFEHGTIQIGVVVADLEKSLDFYINVLGLTKTGGFSINEEFGKRSGLTGGEPFEVTILKLVDSPQATEWKLMSFGKSARHPKQAFIQDDTGMQYVTFFVKSMRPFLERLEKYHVALLGNTPTSLGDGRKFVLVQDPDGTFIELIGPE